MWSDRPLGPRDAVIFVLALAVLIGLAVLA